MRSNAARKFHESDTLPQFTPADDVLTKIRQAEQKLAEVRRRVSIRLPDGKQLAWSGIANRPWRFVVVDEAESVPLVECTRYVRRTALENGYIDQLIGIALS